MIHNFIIKKGDQLNFLVTFNSISNISNIEWGIKKSYNDNFVIVQSMNLVKRNVILIGDSYLEGYTPNGHIKSWGTLLQEKLPNNNYIIKYKGGTGFAYTVDNQNFVTLLDSIPDNSNITDIIVGGGFNDRYCTDNEIVNGISNFVNKAKRKFPNATVKIGMIGWSTDPAKQDSLRSTINSYKKGAIFNKVNYLDNVEDTLHNHNNYFSSDGIHPNEEGQIAIANNMALNLPNVYKGGIQKISDNQYLFTLTSTQTNQFDITKYLYDIRIFTNDIPTTPLSGKIIVKESVFNG